MEIIITGTGTSQGVPVIGCTCPVCQSADSRDKRLRSSAVVRSDEATVLIDIGPDFRQQMLTNSISDISAILLTHEHNDHVSGLDDIRPINFLHRKDIPLYAMSRVVNEMRRRFPYIFDESQVYAGKPRVTLHDLAPGQFTLDGLNPEAIPIMHGKLPIYGYRFGNFCYITDANYIADDVIEELKGIDVLVLNALHHRKHFSHFNLAESVEVIRTIAPARAILTHISHDMGLHAEISEGLPQGIELGYDGLRVTVE